MEEQRKACQDMATSPWDLPRRDNTFVGELFRAVNFLVADSSTAHIVPGG